jgi:hypothetical protein
MGPQILKKFYSGTIESILTGCITARYGNYKATNCKALQRVVSTAQYIMVAELPAIQDLYTRQCQRKAQNNCQTPGTKATDCSLCYRMTSGISAPSLEPTGP